jgi:hypothetical protein
MATKRATFTKIQRERDKRAKADAKRERRASLRAVKPLEATIGEDQHQVIEEIALLHERYEGGRISLDDFLVRRDELLARLVIR